MVTTFKQFILEGGHATAKYETGRATAADIEAALAFVSRTLDVPLGTLKNSLLGSTELTLLGVKPDSGDIDIAMPLSDFSSADTNKKMLDATNGEGEYNAGTKVGSYAVPVNNKKVQVDLMFVEDAEWAKFIYHSSMGNGSSYPGAVRNILMFTALAYTQERDKDFVLRDESGHPIIRASRSITMDSGMKRLFKMAKFNEKTGKYAKTVNSVQPDDIESHLRSLGKNIKFSKELDHTHDPKEIVKFIFGKNARVEDVRTAEGVIRLIKKLHNAREIIEASKHALINAKLPVPQELN